MHVYKMKHSVLLSVGHFSLNSLLHNENYCKRKRSRSNVRIPKKANLVPLSFKAFSLEDVTTELKNEYQ